LIVGGTLGGNKKTSDSVTTGLGFFFLSLPDLIQASSELR